MITFENISFRYPGVEDDVLREISLSVPRGQAVLVTGPTGCGKTTMLKMLNGIIPHESSGFMQGRVSVAGIDSASSTIPELAQLVGLVSQSPDDQLFCNTVYDEIAFGPENLSLSRSDVDMRVQEALSQVGLQGFSSRQIATLSGGQKQRVAIASQLAMKPEVLALDEPVSQLDPKGAMEVLGCIADLKSGGMTIILVEHRIPETVRIVDRIVVIDKGRILLDIEAFDLPRHIETFTALGLRIPDEIQIAKRLGVRISVGNVKSGPEWLERYFKSNPCKRSADTGGKPDCTRKGKEASGATRRETIASISNVTFHYGKCREVALDSVSLDVHRKDVIAVMGHNGCGKSTLLNVIAGLNRPSSGSVAMEGYSFNAKRRRRGVGRAGMVFQNPDLLLVEETLDAELEYGPKNHRVAREERIRRIHRIKERLDLGPMGKVPPHALSKGQRLRAAVGAVLTMHPGILILDEPTTGQNKENIIKLLGTIIGEQYIDAIIFSTHDVDTVARFANRLLLMSEGRIIADGPPTDVFLCPETLELTGVVPPPVLGFSSAAGLPPALTPGQFIESYRIYCGNVRE